MGFLSFSHPKVRNLTWEFSPQISVLFSELQSPILSGCSEVTQVEQKEQHPNKVLSLCVCVFVNHTSSMTWFTKQSRRDHRSHEANPPDSVESGEYSGTATIT